VFQIRGDYQRAISDYSAAIELQNDFASAYYDRGGSCFALRMYDETLSDFRKAFEIGQKDIDAHVWEKFLTSLL
jgi:tetratricopeptide (TPR) repeat protein